LRIVKSSSLFVAQCLFVMTAIVNAQDGKPNAGPLTADEAKKLKNPVPYSKKSIAQGRGLFIRNCAGCHGNDGKATVDVIADATDLTTPKTWKDGTSDGEIFRSIRDGQNASMPAFKTQFHEDEIWGVVNFIHSLWPESMRPSLQDKESTEPEHGKSK
jgi:mono/diheme cytochrome c family protein